MSKFKGLLGKGKGIASNAMAVAKPILLTTGGVVAAQKFLDFKQLFPNVKPDNFMMKHEGLIKVGGVVVTLAVWKNCPEWVKYLLMGVAIQGGIKAIKQYTMNKEGKAFIDNIGAGKYDAEIEEAARQINALTTEFTTQVAGTNKRVELNPAVVLSNYSDTGVAGMGMDAFDLAA